MLLLLLLLLLLLPLCLLGVAFLMFGSNSAGHSHQRSPQDAVGLQVADAYAWLQFHGVEGASVGLE